MPVERRSLGQLVARLAVLLVEEAELDLRRRARRRARSSCRRRPSAGRAGTACRARASRVELDGLVARSPRAASRGRAGAASVARAPRRTSTSSSRGSSRRSRSSSRVRAPPARRGVSFERSNVAASCGSGTSPEKPAKRANSRRRPSRVASAMNGSMWSVKNWNGARLAVLLALEEQRRERAEENDRRRDAPLGVRAAGRRARGCRPGRGSGRRRRCRAPSGRRSSAAMLVHRAVEARVVAVLLAGQRDVQRVVEAVEPHRVVAPLARAGGSPAAPSR